MLPTAAPTPVRRLAVGLPLVAVAALGVLWPLQHAFGLPFMLLNVTVTVAFGAAGGLLSVDPEHRGTARAVGAGALAWSVGWVNAWDTDPWPLVAALVGPLPSLLVAWALLRYPVHWPHHWHERLVVVVFALLQGAAVVSVVFGRPEWHGHRPTTAWLTLRADPTAFQVADTVGEEGGAAVAVAVAVLVAWRISRLRGLDRRAMRPVAVAVVIGSAATCISNLFVARGVSDNVVNRVYGLECLALLAIPLAFLTAAARRWLAQEAVLSLTARLGTAPSTTDLQDALRATLHDPDLALLHRRPFGAETPLDVTGAPARVGGDRLRVEVPGGGLLVVDPGLQRHPELLAAAAGAVSLVTENVRLRGLVQARITETEQSTARIDHAVAAERRRITHQLDSGPQRRLRTAAAWLDELFLELTDPAVRAPLQLVRDQIDLADRDLHDLARGQLPVVLTTHGLGAALATMADQYRRGITVSVPDQRLTGDIEEPAYFAVAELVANAVKHAEARVIEVCGTVEETTAGGALVVEVRDDGLGGADPNGQGLHGVVERVRRVGGSLDLSSKAGQGTRAVIRLPLRERGSSRTDRNPHPSGRGVQPYRPESPPLGAGRASHRRSGWCLWCLPAGLRGRVAQRHE